jgi:hypothetical protein
MVSSRLGKDRATRIVLTLLCMLMPAALLKIVTIQTRNGCKSSAPCSKGRILVVPGKATPRLPTS